MKKNISNREDPVLGTSRPPVNLNVYFVKSGETLESISWDLHLENPNYLREYHNARCSPLDIVPENGTLRLLQKLHIPVSDEILRINRQIRENGESLCYLLPNGKIPLNMNLINGDYFVRQTESDDGTPKYEYAYKLHFSYVKKMQDRHYLHFSMSSFQKDGEEPDEKINHLAADLVKIMYPVTLILDSAGNFVAAESYKEVKEMIREIEALKAYHAGAYAASHIDQMKQNISDPQNMYRGLKKILALQFVFNRFYQAEYRSEDTTWPYRDEFSWLAPASPIQLEMIHKTLLQTDHQFVELLQTGKSVDYRTAQELFYTDFGYDESVSPHSDSVKAKHQAKYILDGKDFSIHKIKAEFDLQMPDYKKKMTFELEKQP